MYMFRLPGDRWSKLIKDSSKECDESNCLLIEYNIQNCIIQWGEQDMLEGRQEWQQV
jgi:hypothetical protein